MMCDLIYDVAEGKDNAEIVEKIREALHEIRNVKAEDLHYLREAESSEKKSV